MMQKSSTMSNYYKIRVSLHSAQAPIPHWGYIGSDVRTLTIVRTSDITINESPSQSEPSPERACSLFTNTSSSRVESLASFSTRYILPHL